MKKLSSLLILLFFVSPSPAAQNGIELTLTISGKIFLGINHRFHLADRTTVRYGVSMGFQGNPIAGNIALLQEANSGNAWAPFAGIGIDAIYTRTGGKKIIRPYPKISGGFAYHPLPGLAHQAELWLAVFPAQKKLFPIGICLSHFNAVLK